MEAITGRDEYTMKYLHLELSTDRLFSMILKQRESYVRKIQGLTMLEVLQGDNSPLQSLGVRTATQLQTTGLSVSWKKVQSTFHEVVLESMWAKAAKLFTSPGALQCAPCCEKNTRATPVYLVLSGSNSREFHSVECSGRLSAVVKCSCAGVKSSGVGMLELYVKKWVGFHSFCSITVLRSEGQI